MKKFLLIILMSAAWLVAVTAQVTGNLNVSAADVNLSKKDSFDIIRIKGADGLTQRIQLFSCYS